MDMESDLCRGLAHFASILRGNFLFLFMRITCCYDLCKVDTQKVYKLSLDKCITLTSETKDKNCFTKIAEDYDIAVSISPNILLLQSIVLFITTRMQARPRIGVIVVRYENVDW